MDKVHRDRVLFSSDSGIPFQYDSTNVTYSFFFFFLNISGFHIVVLFNLSKEKVHIPSNTTK
jgi:hypothetical protein